MKLLVSLLTPLAVVGLGVLVKAATRKAEQAQARASERAERAEWRNRRAIERLLELHAEMAPLMNDLHCFFQVVGNFRDISPPTLIVKKRRLDKIYFVNKHLLSHPFREAYDEFLGECFDQSARPGEDAPIRMSVQWLAGERGTARWDRGWEGMFIEEPGISESMRLSSRQRDKYEKAMDAFAEQLGLGTRDTPPA